MTAQIWDQLAAIGKSAPGAWDELPPLPEQYTEQVVEYAGIAVNRVDRLPLYTADQMRAYAAAAVARERARCSDICDQNASCEGIAQKCAAAIRRG
jgi:hypothetical protein